MCENAEHEMWFSLDFFPHNRDFFFKFLPHLRKTGIINYCKCISLIEIF